MQHPPHHPLAPDLEQRLDQHLDQRLMDLEIKSSFTEDLVDQLNQIIIRQQQQLDALAREVRALRQQGTADSGVPAFRSLRDDLPPHY
jgi:SlyX protein